MQSVADYLGVGKPLLYGYVSSRDELVLMAQAHARRKISMPQDTGQPWALWVLQYAQALFDVLTTDGDLLESWIRGGGQPSTDLGSLVMWVEALGGRGFTGEEALQLRWAVSHLVIGAAASNKHRRALRKSGHSYEELAHAALADLPRQQRGLLRPLIHVLGREIDAESWEFSLYLLLEGVARSRNLLGATSSMLPFETLEPVSTEASGSTP
jgi:AcrR family transcriptional regulator